MISVVAIITAKPGQRDAILAAFAQTTSPPSTAKPGCIEYGTAVDAPDMGRFQTKLGDDSFSRVLEKWQDAAAFGARTRQLRPWPRTSARTKDLVLRAASSTW